MKLPLCKICVKTGILCLSCQEKVDKGLFSILDIRVIDLLYDFKYPADFEYIKAFPYKNRIKLVLKGFIPSSFYKKYVSIMEKKLDKKIDIININDREEIVLKKLVFPYNIIGISRLFRQGEEFLKINLNIKLKPKDKKSLEQIIEKTLNKKVVINAR